MGLLIYACFNMVNLPVRGLEEVQIKLLDAPALIKDIMMNVASTCLGIQSREKPKIGVFKKAINEKC